MTKKLKFGKILEIDYYNEPFVILDLSRNNSELKNFDLTNSREFQKYIEAKLNESGSKFALGGYGEDRIIYDHSELFESEERRSVHLGIDFWVVPGTKVYSPFAGKVHSFNDNAGIGNYGPTIILQHELNEKTIFTLYGHLSKRSLDNKMIGMDIEAGDSIAEVGNDNENGGWAPHLHFQIINDIEDYKGDFPGVCTKPDYKKYKALCPDPNKYLRIKGL